MIKKYLPNLTVRVILGTLFVSFLILLGVNELVKHSPSVIARNKVTSCQMLLPAEADRQVIVNQPAASGLHTGVGIDIPVQVQFKSTGKFWIVINEKELRYSTLIETVEGPRYFIAEVIQSTTKWNLGLISGQPVSYSIETYYICTQ